MSLVKLTKKEKKQYTKYLNRYNTNKYVKVKILVIVPGNAKLAMVMDTHDTVSIQYNSTI